MKVQGMARGLSLFEVMIMAVIIATTLLMIASSSATSMTSISQSGEYAAAARVARLQLEKVSALSLQTLWTTYQPPLRTVLDAGNNYFDVPLEYGSSGNNMNLPGIGSGNTTSWNPTGAFIPAGEIIIGNNENLGPGAYGRIFPVDPTGNRVSFTLPMDLDGDGLLTSGDCTTPKFTAIRFPVGIVIRWQSAHSGRYERYELWTVVSNFQ